MQLIVNWYLKIIATQLKSTVMHDLKSIYNKALDCLNSVTKDYFDDLGNTRHYPNKPKFSDLEVIALAITSECLQIDSENLLWSKLQKDYSDLFTELPHRTNYNKRRRNLASRIQSDAAKSIWKLLWE